MSPLCSAEEKTGSPACEGQLGMLVMEGAAVNGKVEIQILCFTCQDAKAAGVPTGGGMVPRSMGGSEPLSLVVTRQVWGCLLLGGRALGRCENPGGWN